MPVTEKEITPPGAEVNVTPELETALDKATTPEEIRQIIAEEALKQNIVIPPKGEATKEAAKEEPKDKFSFEDTFVIGGKSYKFEGDSAGDINRQVKAAIAAHENALAPEKKAEPVAAKKVLTADDRVALQLDYQVGKISLDDYLEKSGTLDTYLEKRGIKVEALKEVLDEKISTKQNDAWTTAVTEFLKSSDWPGGEQNERIMKYKLAELNLVDPTVDSLEKAYNAMKVDKLVFQNETKEEPTPVATKKKLSGSSVFGIGGGSSVASAVKTKESVPEITADMSPREIMEAFKASAQAQGLNPDDVARQAQRR